HAAIAAAIATIDPGVTRVSGASRTDSGVHASGQVVFFDPMRTIEPRGWVLGLNSRLPNDVAVRAARLVPRGLRPGDVSVGKRYRYLVLRDLMRDPLLDRFAWRITDPLDLDRMQREADALLGTHDFKAFRSSKDERTATARTLTSVALRVGDDDAFTGPRWRDPRLFSITVDGTAFLHNMVRIIVGTLVDVGRGRCEPGVVARGFDTGDRNRLGMTAPAHGLHLEEVQLDEAAIAMEGEVSRWP
ncbi:MAG: tRNA pseudouridine synthase A, partial [Polyangiales bacterium]